MYSKVTEMIEDYNNAGVAPIRVLHVDDEPAHLEITRIFLKREANNDLDITSVPSVDEALVKLNNEFFDVVIADYKMPGMNGIEFLEMIRSDDKFGNIPFILFTGAGGPGIAKEALKQGADRYITKRGDPAVQCHKLAVAIYELALERRKEIAMIKNHRT